MTESAIRQLSRAGFPLDALSAEIRRNRAVERPVGSDSDGNHAATGAVSGAWLGWLLGLCIGVGHPILPVTDLIVARGAVWTSILASIVGGIAGTLIGGLVGAFIGWEKRQKD